MGAPRSTRQKRAAIEGIEPATMSVPKMDRVSVTFALMLDSFKVVSDHDPVTTTWLECGECGDLLCDIEHGDTMRVLFNTALAHSC